MSQGFALKFISGKYQGGEFPLLPNGQIVVGRAPDLDMVLVEDMVSRKHAKISVENGAVTIQDLGSTNGTFVNGEKIQSTRLGAGDRILIGTSILKVLVKEDGATADAADARANLQAIGSSHDEGEKAPTSGSLEDVPVRDLVQLFGTSKRKGVLAVESGENHGQLYFRDGALYYATVNDNHDLGPMKAIGRMVRWSEGSYEFTDDAQPEEFVLELDDDIETVLAEASSHNEALEAALESLPSANPALKIAKPLGPQLASLGSEDLELLQLVHNYGNLSPVMDRHHLSDAEIAQSVVRLLASRYVSAE